MRIIEYDVLVIICDSDEHVLYERLGKQYESVEEMEIKRGSMLYVAQEPKVFVLIGDNADYNVSDWDKEIPILDFRDVNIQHLVSDDMDIEAVRSLLINGIIAPYLNSLIDLDLLDILSAIGHDKTIYTGISNSNSTSDSRELARSFVVGSGVDITKYNNVYVSIFGDVSMMQGEEIIGHLQDMLGENNYIVWSMVYNNEMEDKYSVVAYFMEE